MSALHDFVRTCAAPALRPYGFRQAGRHLALALPDDDMLFLEFNVDRVDPIRDVFDVTFKYALRTLWRWQTLNDPNPRRMDSSSAIAFCDVMPLAGFAWAPDRPRPFCTRWAADLPSEAEALGEAFRRAVDTEILPLAQRMANRERLLAEFDEPDSPVARVAPEHLDVLIRLGRADASEIEFLLAQLPDRTWRDRFANWARSYPAATTT